MPIPSLITDSLVREANRITGRALERQRCQSPWSSLMPKALFEPGMGVTHTAILLERSGATANYDWTNVSVNDGSGNSCVPNADVLSPASTAYTYQLQERAFNSIEFCWNDLYTAWDVQDQIRQIANNFRDEIVDQWENRDRDQYVSIAAHKCVFSGGTLVDNGSASFALTTPDSFATPSVMQEIYQRLLFDGADRESEVGKTDGAPVFVAYMGLEQNQALDYASGTRDDIRWGSDVDSLLQPFNVKRVRNGFVHIVDMKAPRWNFTAGAWVRVPFYTSTSATIGQKLVPNPSYQTAGYEDIIIFLRNVTQREMPRNMTSFGSMTSFETQDFAGAVQWKNIIDKYENPDGNIGYFRAVLQAGYRQLNPNLGYVLRVKRCPNQLSKTTCTGS
jgi:hypothetical protein